MNTKDLKFRNGKFTILQVSDAQDLQWVRKTMLKMLGNAYDRVQPDLVVFTGDNILGNHLRDARFGTHEAFHTKEEELDNMRKAIAHIAKQVENRGIPFTMHYGNHDDMNSITKREQDEIWKSYSHFVGLDNPDMTVEPGTFNLPVYSSDGSRVIYNIWCMDTAWMDKETGECHSGVRREALDWYERTSSALREANGGRPVPSLMFQHISIPEMAQLQWECTKDTPGAVRCNKKGKPEKYVCLNPAKARGVLREPITPYTENYGQYEAILRQGDVRALVLGHEHINNYEADIDGLHIIQTAGASFRCYGDRQRGVRVFEIDENDPEKFTTTYLDYADLCGTSLTAELAYIWDADGMQAQKAALILNTVSLAVNALSLGVTIRRLRKQRNG